MKNTKHQNPNTRKTSNSKLDPTVAYVTGNGGGAWVLKDEPVAGPEQRHPFDLEERTAVFGESIVRFSKTIPRNPSNNRLIDQVVGAGTSVGANFCEANDCFSKKDFRYTVKRCIKEAKETRFIPSNDRCLRTFAGRRSSLFISRGHRVAQNPCHHVPQMNSRTSHFRIGVYGFVEVWYLVFGFLHRP